jgi:hypothetical protein
MTPTCTVSLLDKTDGGGDREEAEGMGYTYIHTYSTYIHTYSTYIHTYSTHIHTYTHTVHYIPPIYMY